MVWSGMILGTDSDDTHMNTLAPACASLSTLCQDDVGNDINNKNANDGICVVGGERKTVGNSVHEVWDGDDRLRVEH